MSRPAPLDARLVVLQGRPPAGWGAATLSLDQVGPICAERPRRLTVWAPAGTWPRAFGLLALCTSLRVEDCRVLTDLLPPIELVPRDGRVATLAGGGDRPPLPGGAAYSCCDLRGDRIFQLLLAGRARRQPELRPLLDLHALSLTARGRAFRERWQEVLPSLFEGGLSGMMPAPLRAGLEELAGAARDSEHAIIGGFHALDPVVRGPAEWEAGARAYLPLAAARSAPARLAVAGWLAASGEWRLAPARRAEDRRRAAARALHRLVDDPWLGEAAASRLFTDVASRR